MNSCIYISRIYHERLKPKKNIFNYRFYMLYLDLDEIDSLAEKVGIFSHNRWNILSFYDSDHFKFLRQKGISEKISKEKVDFHTARYKGKGTKERIRTMIEELGLGFDLGKVFILTNVRNLGYLFNPVSFYYCFDEAGKPRVMFSEVNNTFGEQKMYYTMVDPGKKVHKDKQRKNYYISPFIDYDTDIHWRFTVPGRNLDMEVTSKRKNDSVLKAVLKGKRKQLTGASMLMTFLRYPMVPLVTMILIHYQALKLFMKRVQFHPKKKTDRKIVDTLSTRQ